LEKVLARFWGGWGRVEFVQAEILMAEFSGEVGREQVNPVKKVFVKAGEKFVQVVHEMASC
jgi:hypothetical protein